MKKSIFSFLSLALVLTGCSFNKLSSGSASAKKTYSTYLNKKVKHVDQSSYSPTLIFNGEQSSYFANKNISDSYYDVIIHVDDSLNVKLDQNDVDLTTYLDTYIKGKYVPVVELQESNVDTFINYFKNTYAYLDMMVMSKSLSVLDKLYKDSETHILGSIYDIREAKLESNQFKNWSFVKNANLVGCNTLYVNAKDPNLKVAVSYFTGMTKNVWAYSEDTLMDATIATSGCMGIVSSNPLRTLSSLSKFSQKGRLAPTNLAAHRGITGYANENSLSSSLFAASEGATHIEIDVQICADHEIVLCHNSQTNYNSDKTGWYFVNLTYEQLKRATLNDYSNRYEETYATLSSLIENIINTDIIVIVELKFDNGSTKAVKDLQCIENLKRVVDQYPEFAGHWFAITFFAPLAEKMQELMPEIPVGYLGGATSGHEKDQQLTAWGKGGGHKNLSDFANKIKLLRYYNLANDESFDEKNGSGFYYYDLTCDFYLAHGYLLNTWTYEDLKHLENKTNIATSNVVEKCADLLMDFPFTSLTLTNEQYNSGKVKVNTLNYNRWNIERECQIIPLVESGDISVILYYSEVINNINYGRYSSPIHITIK